jgi:hypothetical protein
MRRENALRPDAVGIRETDADRRAFASGRD